MHSRGLTKKTILIAILTGLVALSPALIFIPEIVINSNPVSLIESTVFFPTQEQADMPVQTNSSLLVSQPGKPMRLSIPKIDVDATVEYVGLTPDGAMDVPKERANVAWFEIGPRPGENGSAVIAGHYGIKNGKGSVFDDLHNLRKGDKLYIKDDRGLIISFVVRESRRYDSKADVSNVFDSNDGKSHLNLVTCEGVWDEGTQQYPRRLVVFADRDIE